MADTDLEGASGGAEPLQRSNDVQNVQSTNDDHGNIDVHIQNGSTNIQNTDIFLGGKKIFIVSKQKNRQKIQKIDIYNIHKLYTK